MRFGRVTSIRWLLLAICVLWVVARSADARRRINTRRSALHTLTRRSRFSRGLRAKANSQQKPSWTTDPTLSASPNRLKHRLERLPSHRRLIPRQRGGILNKKHERRWLQEVERNSAGRTAFLKFAETQHEEAIPTHGPLPRGESEPHQNASLRTPVRHETTLTLLEYLQQEPDLETMWTFLMPDVIPMFYAEGKEKRSTLFLPTNTPFTSKDYLNFIWTWWSTADKKQLTADMRNITNHYVSVGEMISPSDIVNAKRDGKPLVVQTLDNAPNNSLSLEARYNEEGNSMDLYVEDVLVKEAIELQSVWVYKIDNFLYRRWNNGVTLAEFVARSPGFTFFNGLVTNGGFGGHAEKGNGPITVFLVPDNDVLGTPGAIPACMKAAVYRKENADFTKALLNTFVVPGLWTLEQWSNSTKFFSLAGDRLNITRVCEGAHCPVEFLVNGVPLVTRNIPISNGVAHVLSRLPAFPAAINKDAFIWECMNTLCNECPTSAEKVLLYVDQKRCEPDYDDKLPESGCITRGSRPDWVCREQSAWFPPGWSAQEWNIHKKQNLSGYRKQVPDRRLTLMRHGRVYYELLPLLQRRFPAIARRLHNAHLELAGAACPNHKRSYIRNFVRNIELWVH